MADKNPLVSVVIPTYNRADKIDRSLTSVLNQTYENLEVVVVDDGSTDNTEEVIRSYEDTRVHYIGHEENKGATAARNTGIEAAKGEFIAFQDSDDEWHPKKIEKQVEAYMNSPDDYKVIYTIVCGNLTGGGKIYVPERWAVPRNGDIHHTIRKGSCVSTVGIFTNKSCLEKVGYFDENFPRLQDWELAFRLSKHYKFKLVDEVMVEAYHDESSITEDNEALAEAIEMFLEKHKKDFEGHEDILSEHYFWLASVLFSLDRDEEAQKYLKKGVSLKPFCLLTFIRLFASILGHWFFNNFRGFYRRIAYPTPEDYNE